MNLFRKFLQTIGLAALVTFLIGVYNGIQKERAKDRFIDDLARNNPGKTMTFDID